MNLAAEHQPMKNRSFVIRRLRWWTFRRCITTIAWGCTLLVLFCVCYLWAGQRGWDKYKHELAAKGESLDWAAYIPADVSDEQNFAQTPFLAPLLDYLWDSKQGRFIWRDPVGYQRATNFARSFGWPFDEKTIHDLTLPIDKTDRSDEESQFKRRQFAAHVLDVLQEYGPVLEELHKASIARPKSRFKIHYDEGPLALLPHLGLLGRVSHILRLRASAQLELGQGDLAFRDLMLIFYLANCVKDEPFLPSQLTRRSFLISGIQCLHQALDRHLWRVDQLQAIESELSRIDLLGEYLRTLRAERVRGNQMIELARETRNPSYLWSSGDETDLRAGKPMFLLRLLPAGWFYKNQTEYNRIYQELALSGVDDKTHRIYPARIDENTRIEQSTVSDFSGWLFHHRLIVAQFLASGPIRFVELPFARTQVWLDHSMIACGLERYRLVHHEFPQGLLQLNESLPHDIFSGESYKYRRISADQFILYSVGWNGKDDGGIYRGNLKQSEYRKLPVQQRKDDWTWNALELDRSSGILRIIL
jgi:hypothetical protein